MCFLWNFISCVDMVTWICPTLRILRIKYNWRVGSCIQQNSLHPKSSLMSGVTFTTWTFGFILGLGLTHNIWILVMFTRYSRNIQQHPRSDWWWFWWWWRWCNLVAFAVWGAATHSRMDHLASFNSQIYARDDLQLYMAVGLETIHDFNHFSEESCLRNQIAPNVQHHTSLRMLRGGTFSLP